MIRRFVVGKNLIKKAVFLFLEFLGLSTLVYIIIGLFHPSFARIPSDILGKEKYHLIFSERVFSSLKWFILCFLITLLLWGVRKAKGRWTLRDLGYRVHESWGKDIWLGAVVFCLFFLIRLPLTIVNFPGRAELAAGSDFYDSLLTSSFPFFFIFLSFLFMALSTLGAAFWEEVFWRGYLQTLFWRKISPATGFLLTAIIFGLGHFFTRPDWGKWGMLFALSSLISGISFGIAYYMTGSLISVAAIHFFGNFWSDYPLIVYINGNRRGAYIFVILLAALSLAVCLVGRRRIQQFWIKTKELFSGYGWKMALAGIALCSVGLAYEWARGWLRAAYQKENPAFLGLILVVFAVVTLGVSFAYKEKKGNGWGHEKSTGMTGKR